MIEALKNPHFKKIWEEVNWKIRHPEAKSLEEALKFEKKHFDCVFIYNNISGYCGENCIYLRKEINNYNALANEHCESLNFFEKQKFMKMIDLNAKILGRPITLEDILLLLTKNGKARNEIGIILLENGNLCIKPQTGGEYDFDWEYSKPFYEQSPETWEKISKLIK